MFGERPRLMTERSECEARLPVADWRDVFQQENCFMAKERVEAKAKAEAESEAESEACVSPAGKLASDEALHNGGKSPPQDDDPALYFWGINEFYVAP